MNNGMRWRIMTLQGVLVLVLGFCAGFLFYESNFVSTMVTDQLTAQQISFPGTDQIKAGGALDPAEFPASIRQYAGTKLDTGDKAFQYGNNFIGKHLQTIAGGKTYAQVSAAAQANPTDPKLAGQKAALFQGETLRGMLLNAWGWSQMGLYASYAAIGLMIAAIGVFGAFIFELSAVLRRETQKVRPIPATKAAVA